MSDLRIQISEQFYSIAANATEERDVCVAMPGSWLIEKAYFVPSTTSAANATNYATITITKGTGGTTLGTLTSASTALTKGTPREFTLTSAPGSMLLTGGSDVLEFAVTQAASGAVVDGQVCVVLKKIPS